VKKAFFILLYVVSQYLTAQIQEDFSRSFFLPWQGDTAKFQLASGKLQSNSSTLNDQYYIARKNSNNVREWLLDVELKFNTSSANYIDYYLLANGQKLIEADTALFIRVGNTKDEISLYQRQGGGSKLLMDGLDGVTKKSSSKLRLRIVITEDSLKLDYALDLSKPIFANAQSIQFDTLALAHNDAHTGLFIRQSTASFFKDHYFDNLVSRPILKDTVKPKIITYQVNDSKSMSLFFSESVDLNLLNSLSNYRILETMQYPISAVTQSQDSVQLIFNKAFTSAQKRTLQVDSLVDLSGNVQVKQQIMFTYTRIVEPYYKSILISEIYAKPSSNGLQVEAFEIYNTTDDFINAQGVSLSDLTSEESFPEHVLPPKSYWIVCDDSDTAMFNGLNVIPLKTMPSLNDAEDVIRLKTVNNELIGQVFYHLGWHDGAKRDGGWSLEMKDLIKGCYGFGNFRSSVAVEGHTLGKQNSVNGILSEGAIPKIESLYVTPTGNVILRWNKVIDYRTAISPASYTLRPNIGLDSVRVNLTNPREVTLYLNTPILSPVQCSVNSFTNCDGIVVPELDYFLNIPRLPKEGDLQITEIMFNAETGCTEFIEIDNQTDSVLDLRNVFLGVTSAFKQDQLNISDRGDVLFPEQKLLLVQDLSALKKCYNFCESALIIELKDWSSLDNRMGRLSLTNYRSELLDTLLYDKAYHTPLLAEVDGVSLEKIGVKQSGLLPHVWSSSNSIQNYATPGCKNTEINNAIPKEKFTLGNPYFQSSSQRYPKASILYQLDKANYKLSIKVLSRKGILVKEVISNGTVGTSGNFFWDGTNSQGNNVALGIYYIHITAVHSDGLSLRKVLEVTKLD